MQTPYVIGTLKLSLNNYTTKNIAKMHKAHLQTVQMILSNAEPSEGMLAFTTDIPSTSEACLLKPQNLA
jgi:hypothetical protein